MIDYGLNPKLKEIFDFLSKKSYAAYSDRYLLTNETLSKNPFSSCFVRDAFEQGDVDVQSSFIFTAIKRFLAYYLKNGIALFAYFINYLVFKIYRIRKQGAFKELVLIDTFFMVNKILASQKFSDGYLLGLGDVLEKNKISFLYLARFYGGYSPIKMFKTLRVLEKNKIGYICEFDLLGMADILKLVKFYFLYPFSVLRFISLSGSEVIELLFKKSMLHGLSEISIGKYSRYLTGKNLKKLNAEHIKLVSWYENQSVDKSLYAGVRDGGVNCYIIGVQAFLFSKIYLSALVDGAEVGLGIVPDKVLVNGSVYLPNATSVKFEVGPSFRYKKIFTENEAPKIIKQKNEKKILVLLSFDIEQNMKLLSCFEGVQFDSEITIFIKPHQDLPPASYKGVSEKIPNSKIVFDDIYVMFKDADLVVGASSGTLIEALSFGLNVLQFCRGGFEYKMLEDGVGKGAFWDDFNSKKELLAKIKIFFNNPAAMDPNKTRNFYADYFSEPTEEAILKAIGYL